MNRNTILLAIAIAASCVTAHAADSIDPLPAEVKRFIGAYSILESMGADPVNSEQAFYQGAIPGMLRKLDPHSVFFDPGQFAQLKQMQSSTSKGFGSVVSVLPGRVIVLQAMPGTPSAKSGIAPGDEILAVNGIRLDRLNLDQLIEVLSQSRQQPARLDVHRAGNAALLRFTLVPEEMQSPSVERAFMVRPGIAYLRVGSFDEKTGQEIHAAIEKLGGSKLKGLVLDLRNNPGGLVNAAIETASLFLKPGQTILTIRGRHVDEKQEKVAEKNVPYDFPVAILVNSKTASASEIVSGALQDHDRAVILGEASFGKGLVQSVFPLTQGTGVALTTALYYTPSGRSIQKPLTQGDFELGETTAHPNQRSDFLSDKGRPLPGGGGIIPDIAAYPAPYSRLRAVLEASGAFTTFATEFLKTQPDGKVDERFEVTPKLLDQFQAWLAERQIQPNFTEWSAETGDIRARLKIEIFNQGLGIEKGDEIDLQRDPVMQRAFEAIGAH
jgi:carboxyl-terminal processing protease